SLLTLKAPGNVKACRYLYSSPPNIPDCCSVRYPPQFMEPNTSRRWYLESPEPTAKRVSCTCLTRSCNSPDTRQEFQPPLNAASVKSPWKVTSPHRKHQNCTAFSLA